MGIGQQGHCSFHNMRYMRVYETDYSFWPDCKAIPAYGLMMSVRPSVCPSVRLSVCQHFG